MTMARRQQRNREHGINLNPALKILSKFDSTNNLDRIKTAAPRRANLDSQAIVI
jgi:hypothetical protein